MEDNKTKWNKKKEFSDTPQEFLDENFQTINMIQKIKKAKKKKNVLNLENYKNIEPLQNIYEDNDKKQDNIKKTNKKEAKEKEGKEKGEEEKKIKEGFVDDDYEGWERPDKRGGDSPKDKLVNFIDDCFATIYAFNHKYAKLIAKIFSHNTQSKQDVLLIQKYLGVFESIGVSYFAAYNWFFYLFYSVNYDPTREFTEGQPDENGVVKELEKPKQPEFSRHAVTEASRKYKIIDIWIWFCEYVILFTEYYQWIKIHLIPILFAPFNNKVRFIFLFFLFIYILNNLMTTLRNILVDALNYDFKNIYVVCGLIIFLVFYISAYWFPAKSEAEADQVSAATSQKLIMSTWFIIIPYILLCMVRAFILYLITVPVGALFLALYIVFFSLFGVTAYYLNIFKAYEIFNNMYIFIKEDVISNSKTKHFGELNFIEKFGAVVNNFSESIHRYILYITYIIMLLVAGVDYFKYIDSYKLKINMLIITFVLCIIFISIVASLFLSHALSNENT